MYYIYIIYLGLLNFLPAKCGSIKSFFIHFSFYQIHKLMKPSRNSLILVPRGSKILNPSLVPNIVV